MKAVSLSIAVFMALMLASGCKEQRPQESLSPTASFSADKLNMLPGEPVLLKLTFTHPGNVAPSIEISEEDWNGLTVIEGPVLEEITLGAG